MFKQQYQEMALQSCDLERWRYVLKERSKELKNGSLWRVR